MSIKRLLGLIFPAYSAVYSKGCTLKIQLLFLIPHHVGSMLGDLQEMCWRQQHSKDALGSIVDTQHGGGSADVAGEVPTARWTGQFCLSGETPDEGCWIHSNNQDKANFTKPYWEFLYKLEKNYVWSSENTQPWYAGCTRMPISATVNH